MFKHKTSKQFDIAEHPDVVEALNAIWAAAYDAGRRDALATAKDERAEMGFRPWEGDGDRDVYLDGMDRLIELLEI